MIIEGIKSQKEIAVIFNTNTSMISAIKHGVSWASAFSDEDAKKMRETTSNRSLTIEEVFKVRDLLIEGVKTTKQIARFLNINDSHVAGIRTGKKWASIITEEDVIKMNENAFISNRKITIDMAIEIKSLLLENSLSQAEIARRMNVSSAHITLIKQGKTWSNLFSEDELHLLIQRNPLERTN